MTKSISAQAARTHLDRAARNAGEAFALADGEDAAGALPSHVRFPLAAVWTSLVLTAGVVLVLI